MWRFPTSPGYGPGGDRGGTTSGVAWDRVALGTTQLYKHVLTHLDADETHALVTAYRASGLAGEQATYATIYKFCLSVVAVARTASGVRGALAE